MLFLTPKQHPAFSGAAARVCSAFSDPLFPDLSTGSFAYQEHFNEFSIPILSVKLIHSPLLYELQSHVPLRILSNMES